MLKNVSLNLFFMSLCFIASESCKATGSIPREVNSTTVRRALPTPPDSNGAVRVRKRWLPAAPIKDPKLRAHWERKVARNPAKYQFRGKELFIKQ